jgi:hypothetical protein
MEMISRTRLKIIRTSVIAIKVEGGRKKIK